MGSALGKGEASSGSLVPLLLCPWSSPALTAVLGASPQASGTSHERLLSCLSSWSSVCCSSPHKQSAPRGRQADDPVTSHLPFTIFLPLKREDTLLIQPLPGVRCTRGDACPQRSTLNPGPVWACASLHLTPTSVQGTAWHYR